MELVLYRYFLGADCSQGLLYVNKKFFCDTLELPWLNNKINISCIPTGKYSVEYKVSRKHGECLKIPFVDGRSHILIHSGNYVTDTKGCILVGVKNNKILINSKKTLIRLLKEGKEGILIIRNL